MVKAQSGMDFLMTYGWALLIVVIIVGALFGLGIFDEGTFVGSKASGFNSIGVSAWQLKSDGTLSLKIRNNAATDIQITSINATRGNESKTYTTVVNLANGKETTLNNAVTFTNAATVGQTYTVQIEMKYTDTKSGFSYMDKGTITGKVTST